MTDRHKVKPMSLRLPEALSALLAQQSADTGKPVRRLILEAIETAYGRPAGTTGAGEAP